MGVSASPQHSDQVEQKDMVSRSKRTTPCDFSKIVDRLNNQAELEGDLSRLEQSLSVVDIKVEIQELEKFSILTVLQSSTSRHNRAQSILHHLLAHQLCRKTPLNNM